MEPNVVRTGMEADAYCAVFILPVERPTLRQDLLVLRSFLLLCNLLHSLLIDRPNLQLAVVASCDTPALVGRETQAPTFTIALSHMRLDAMSRCEIPHFDQRVLSRRKQESFLLAHTIYARIDLGGWCQEMQRGDLIRMPPEFEETSFGKQIPDDNIRVFRTAGKPDAGRIKGQLGDSCLVTVERDDD